MYSDLKYLEVPLPEDVQKLKWHGDFTALDECIAHKLQKDIPHALRKRLELEREIIRRIPQQYPYSKEKALELLKDTFKDFTESEFRRLWLENAVEWIYRDGVVYLHKLFIDNLVKTRPDFASRCIHPENFDDSAANFALLNTAIDEIKKEGRLTYYFRIKSTLEVPSSSVAASDALCVHIPVPVEYAQVKNLKLLGTSPKPDYIAASDYPQRTVCFTSPASECKKFSVEYEFENHIEYREPAAESVSDAQPTFYTEEQAPHIRFTPYIKMLASEIIGKETNPLVKARKIYDYITTHVMYSFVRSYITIDAISEYVASGLKGDCGIQALLFITLCRYAGIPARWQAGLYATPLRVGNHDWAQFYIAPYGWLFADCSFGGSAYRHKDMNRWNYYFGNIDPYRIPLASDFQHEFALSAGNLRNDPYDNQTGEAAVNGKNLFGDEFDAKAEAVAIQKR